MRDRAGRSGTTPAPARTRAGNRYFRPSNETRSAAAFGMRGTWSSSFALAFRVNQAYQSRACRVSCTPRTPSVRLPTLRVPRPSGCTYPAVHPARSHADRKPDEEPASERIVVRARRPERVVRRRSPDDRRLLVENVVDAGAQPITIVERPAAEEIESVVRLRAERVRRRRRLRIDRRPMRPAQAERPSSAVEAQRRERSVVVRRVEQRPGVLQRLGARK